MGRILTRNGKIVTKNGKIVVKTAAGDCGCCDDDCVGCLAETESPFCLPCTTPNCYTAIVENVTESCRTNNGSVSWMVRNVNGVYPLTHTGGSSYVYSASGDFGEQYGTTDCSGAHDDLNEITINASILEIGGGLFHSLMAIRLGWSGGEQVVFAAGASVFPPVNCGETREFSNTSGFGFGGTVILIACCD